MIVGVEGVHTWESGLVLNDRASYPQYRVRRISGLRSSADFDPVADVIVGRTGEVPRLGDRAGKTLVYEGRTIAQTLADLRSAEADLTAAFSGTSERRMTAAPHDSYEGEDLPTRFFFARPLDTADDDEQQASPFRSSRGYEREFSVALRMSDPRYFFEEPVSVQSESGLVAVGLPLPFDPGDSLVPPAAEGFEVDVTNAGNADVEPVIEVAGPCFTPVVSRASDGLFLRFGRLSVAYGEVLTIDFHERSARIGSTNVRGTLRPGSTWWNRGKTGIDPGDETVRLRGRGLGFGSSLTATFYPADFA